MARSDRRITKANHGKRPVSSKVRKQKRKTVRIRDDSGTFYGFGVEVTDPYDGGESKVVDILDLTQGAGLRWLVKLESGTHFAVEATCWRVLDYIAGDTNENV